ncbi:hypothetical protein [Hymenobacter sp. UYP22]|uniref:hypothetical protein n=1 Tax=Hymenobacter sp. UYP22 TaxID=3156348 RepID=UPI00339A8FAD
MFSYPTPEGIARTEQLGPHFAKVFLPETPHPLHIFTQPDTGDYHDHPFSFVSHVLLEGYVEQVVTLLPDGGHRVDVVHRFPGTSHRVEAHTIHRIIELPAGYCVTRVEAGPVEQTSGFWRFDELGNWHRYWNETEWSLQRRVAA